MSEVRAWYECLIEVTAEIILHPPIKINMIKYYITDMEYGIIWNDWH